MSIHDATSVASSEALSSASSVRKVTKSLTNTILAKKLLQLNRKCYKCFYAKSYDQLPVDDIAELNTDLVAYYSGPDQGISDISLVSSRQAAAQTANKQQPPPLLQPQPPSEDALAQPSSDEKQQPKANDSLKPQQPQNSDCWDSFEKSGIKKFNTYHHRAYGIACSLYENNPNTNTTVGDPVADVFAILTRKSCSILSLADGVNWGPRSRLAARCAVRANVNYINKNLFFSTENPPTNTHEVFKIMCRSFDAAQELILRKKGTVTTLCCSVVVKLKDHSSHLNQLWAVCTLSIGDSTAYVFNRTKGVFELTYGARNLNSDRDMRNVGGALGHVYGNKPDVSNLIYSIMYVKSNYIVFLVSDGVSDNMDPIVSQTARKQENKELNQNLSRQESKAQKLNDTKLKVRLNRCASQSHRNLNKSALFAPSLESDVTKQGVELDKPRSVDDNNVQLSSLPEMSPYERYICSLAHMNEILIRNKTLNDTISAQETCAILIEHVMRLTAAKRETLEKGLVEAAKIENDQERARYQASLRERANKMRGKLDHASIVAYEVGIF